MAQKIQSPALISLQSSDEPAAKTKTPWFEGSFMPVVGTSVLIEVNESKSDAAFLPVLGTSQS